MTPFPTTRLLPRYRVDLPVQVVFHHGAEKLSVGMVLYAGLMLKASDPIEQSRSSSRYRLGYGSPASSATAQAIASDWNSSLFFRLNRHFPRLFHSFCGSSDLDLLAHFNRHQVLANLQWPGVGPPRKFDQLRRIDVPPANMRVQRQLGLHTGEDFACLLGRGVVMDDDVLFGHPRSRSRAQD
jgi:hypothetical protein